MKICLLVAVALICFTSAVITDRTDFRPDCSARANPFRYALVKIKNLELLKTPLIINNVCGQEWETFGTCCETDILKEIVKNDQIQIQNAIKELKQEFKSMAFYLISKFIPTLKSIENNLKSSNWKNISPEEAIFLTELVNDPVLNFMSNEPFQKTNHTADNTFDSCWNYQKSLRSVAVCSSCSANSKRFFTKRTAIVSDSICDTLIDKCSDSVFTMNRLLNSYNTLYKNQPLLMKVGIIINAREKLPSTFFKAFGKYQSPLLDTATTLTWKGGFKRSLVDDRANKASFCQYMTRLNLPNKPYVVAFAQLIRGQVAWRLDMAADRYLSAGHGSDAGVEERGMDGRGDFDGRSEVERDSDDPIKLCENNEPDTTFMSDHGDSNQQIVKQNADQSQPMSFKGTFP